MRNDIPVPTPTPPQVDKQALLDREIRAVFHGTYDQMDWEAILSAWWELQKLGDAVEWATAALCALIDVKYGEGSLKAFALDVNKGLSTVYRLRRTWMAFPSPEMRNPELSFTHHSIAAATNDPQYWLDYAHLHELSTHALGNAIRQAAALTRKALAGEEEIIDAEAEVVEEIAQEVTPEHEMETEMVGHDIPSWEDKDDSAFAQEANSIALPHPPYAVLGGRRPGTYLHTHHQATAKRLKRIVEDFVIGLMKEGYLLSEINDAVAEVLSDLK